MKFEVEVINNEVLPAIRSIIAQELKDEYGLTQKEIAQKLGITQPAVSQYLTQTRADPKTIQNIEQDPQTYLLIRDAAEKALDNENYAEEIRQVIQNIRDKGLLKEKFKDTEKII